MAQVLMVTKDSGGTNATLPIEAPLTNQFRHSVLLAANGLARGTLADTDKDFVAFNSPDRLIAFGMTDIDVMVTSMCSKGGLGRDLVSRMRKERIPVVGIQDYWAGQIFPGGSWSDEGYRPDHITVNDQLATDLVLKAWPEYEPAGIYITGSPAFDKYHGFDANGASSAFRESLGLVGKRVVLFCGQAHGTADALSHLVAALSRVDKDAVLMPRFHPRMKEYGEDEYNWCQAIIESCDLPIADSRKFKGPSEACLAAADVVVSMYSTMLIEATCLRRPCLSILGPDSTGMRFFKEETGNSMNEFPLVTLGCAAGAASTDDAADILSEMFSGKLDQRGAQCKHFKLDGKSALRAAEVVHNAIS